MESIEYKYRIVFVGKDWYIHIEGFPYMDDVELREVMNTLTQTHNWNPQRQVFTYEKDVSQGVSGSIGLNLYNAYTRAKYERWRNDIMVTDWFKSSIY